MLHVIYITCPKTSKKQEQRAINWIIWCIKAWQRFTVFASTRVYLPTLFSFPLYGRGARQRIGSYYEKKLLLSKHFGNPFIHVLLFVYPPPPPTSPHNGTPAAVTGSTSKLSGNFFKKVIRAFKVGTLYVSQLQTFISGKLVESFHKFSPPPSAVQPSSCALSMLRGSPRGKKFASSPTEGPHLLLRLIACKWSTNQGSLYEGTEAIPSSMTLLIIE